MTSTAFAALRRRTHTEGLCQRALDHGQAMAYSFAAGDASALRSVKANTVNLI